MTTTMTKDEALVQMTMRWLEAEARLQQAEAHLQQHTQRSLPLEDFQILRKRILERTSPDLYGTVDRFFAEAFGARQPNRRVP